MKRATIDRIEDEVVVLVADGRELHRRRSELPADAREGDVVDLDTMELDPEATDRLRSEIQAARARAKKHKAPPGDL